MIITLQTPNDQLLKVFNEEMEGAQRWLNKKTMSRQGGNAMIALGEKVSERVRVLGSSSCTCCKYYSGRGEYHKKWNTGYIQSVLCKHPKANGNST